MLNNLLNCSDNNLIISNIWFTAPRLIYICPSFQEFWSLPTNHFISSYTFLPHHTEAKCRWVSTGKSFFAVKNKRLLWWDTLFCGTSITARFLLLDICGKMNGVTVCKLFFYIYQKSWHLTLMDLNEIYDIRGCCWAV